MRPSRFLLKTLSVFALGVFLSCAPNSPDPIYPQNRNVTSLDYRDLDPSVDAAIQNGTYPDSLSGWRLAWTLPDDTVGLNAIYIFADTIPEAISKNQLVSGSGGFNLNGLNLLATISRTDTTWEIPARAFGGKRGRGVRSDTTYFFSVWVRYNGDVAGAPVSRRMYLGDEMYPILPAIFDSVGKNSATLRFARPLDQTSRFDTLMHGPIASIQARWWPGFSAADSVKVTNIPRPGQPDSLVQTNVVQSVAVPVSKLKNLLSDSFSLELAPLRYFTNYMYTLVVTDSAGLVNSSPPRAITTRDSLAPSSVAALTYSIRGQDTLILDWQAASDTFSATGAPLPIANYRIAKYVVHLGDTPFDSIELPYAVGNKSRFNSFGGRWTWTWPNLRPGKGFEFAVSVQDSSGNFADSAPKVSGTSPSPTTFVCPVNYMPIQGTGKLKNYCIEEREHRVDGVAQKSMTWAEAITSCAVSGAYLCSDSQWVRACETHPTSSQILEFGSVETGSLLDSLPWLQSVCRLGSGDSTSLNTATPDPRCVSAWGVYDMPGSLAEWTRDVYHSNPSSSGLRDSNSLAWLDTSDLTRKPDLGTIHGGSWLKLDQTERTLPSARCRERNYPAFSKLYDSLPTPHRSPNPRGSSNGVGFRCCRMPSP